MLQCTFVVYLSQVVLGEFITSQLAHHAKALELYTLAYRHVQNISEDETVEVCLHAH